MSTVIKAGQAGPLLRTLATVDLADHFGEARDVLQRARMEAVRILESASREAAERNAAANRDVGRARDEARQEGRKEGHREGFEVGRKAGFDEAFAEAKTRFALEQAHLVDGLTRAVAAVEGMKAEVVTSAERDLLDFALTVVSKMTFAVGRQYRESVSENFRRALRLVGDQSILRVRVHPQDQESLRAFAPEALEALQRSTAVHIEADESMAPGGCVVETELTRVDASLEVQVSDLTRMLVGEQGERG